MSLLSQSAVRNRKDPAPAWRWVVDMPPLLNPPTAVPPGFKVVLDIPRGYVEAVTIPQYNFDSYSFVEASQTFNMPSETGSLNANLTMYEDSSYTTIKYLTTWSLLVRDYNGDYGNPSIFKKTIYCNLHDTASHTTPKLTMKLVGCWLSSIDHISLEHRNSTNITYGVQLNVDNISIQ